MNASIRTAGDNGISKLLWIGFLALAAVATLGSLRDRVHAGSGERTIVIPVAEIEPASEAERAPAEEPSASQSYPVITR